jgi:hypothetical protein
MLAWSRRLDIAPSILREGDEKGGKEAFKVVSLIVLLLKPILRAFSWLELA